MTDKASTDYSSWFSKPQHERLVLSLCLKHMSCFIETDSQLEALDFLGKDNRALYIVLTTLKDTIGVEKFDITTVISAASDLSLLNDIGGYSYIDALFNTSVDKSNLQAYIRQVLDASIKFKTHDILLGEAENVHNKAHDDTPASSIVSEVEEKILSVSLDTLKVEDAVQISLGLRERLKEFEENPEVVRGTRTGFPLLDMLLNGLMPGRLYIVAARKKTGKSLYLLNMSTHVCLEEKKPVLFIDTEMSKEEFQTRQLSMLSGVPEKTIINGLYKKDAKQTEAVYYALKVMEKMPFFHKQMPGAKIDDVRSMARKYASREKIGAFFYDYIKMTDMDKNFNETQTLGNITSSLKDLSSTLSIPVISAVQVSRLGENKSKIDSSMIGESDRIARYCNVLMGLTQKTREEIQKDGLDCGTHRLQILDNRGGSTLYNGIDLSCRKTILTVKEAKIQSSESFLEHKQVLKDEGFTL